MEYTIIPTAEQWAVLKELGLTTGESVVLISPSMAQKHNLTDEIVNQISEDYDFGGDPDCWLEVVVDDEHYFIDHAREKGIIE